MKKNNFNIDMSKFSDLIIDDFIIDEEVIIDIVLDNNNHNMDQLYYYFMGRDFVFSNEHCNLKARYGYVYPLSIIGAIYNKHGIAIIMDDQLPKNIAIIKNYEKMVIRVTYFNTDSDRQPKIILTRHSGDWHDGITVYKKWYERKYDVFNNKKTNIEYKGKYHIQRFFFNRKLCPGNVSDCQVSIERTIQEAKKEAGGIDVILMFDFAYDLSTGIRCGNLELVNKKIDLKKITCEIIDARKQYNISFFAYFDPYLIESKSDMDQCYSNRAEITDDLGKRVQMWGDLQWAPCIAEESWKENSINYIKNILNAFKIDGIYLDEFGNGEQYVCENKLHKHEIPIDQNRAEGEYVDALKKITDSELIMCEFFPCDLNVHRFAGMLSDSNPLVDIVRFVFPNKKIFKMVACDRPLGNNIWALNMIFFNGMGLWIDGDLKSEEWYPQETKKVIKKHYMILKKYSNCFESFDVTPLITVYGTGIIANRFRTIQKTIITYINPTDCIQKIEIDIPYNCNFFIDLMNDKIIFAENNRIRLVLDPKKVGCLLCYLEN